MNVIAIIQARVASSRLYNKVFSDINGMTMLMRVIKRAQQSTAINEVCIATTVDPGDDAIVKFCQDNAIKCFRGSSSDVLDRYYKAAVEWGKPVVVRITSDCPMIDPEIITKVVNVFLGGDYDYVSNVIVPTYPDGLDVEVMSFDALERMWKEAKMTSEREHVTLHIRKNPQLFKTYNVSFDEDLSKVRLTVDEYRDLMFAKNVYASFPDDKFLMKDILELLHKHPEIKEINEGIERDEGMKRSLASDKPYNPLEGVM